MPHSAVRVACVLRSGGVYGPEYVARLKAGVDRHLPGAGFLCLADVPLECDTVELKHGWPGWWSKLELFRPDIEGDLLYFDLDTIITGDLADIARVRSLALLADFYRAPRMAGALGSGMMFIPQAAKAEIWKSWMARPPHWMRVYHQGGDQSFLERHWRTRARTWQQLVPGQVVSYKVHCRDGVPADARVVCFHGKPKPSDVNWLE